VIAYFAQHRTAANLMMVAFLILGVTSLGRLRRATFPDYRPTEIEVRYVFPGAIPEEIEETILRRVENELDSVRHVDEIRSYAQDAVAVLTLRMEEYGDAAAFKDEIQTAVDGITGFPQGVEDPVIRQLGTTELVLDLLVTGPMNDRHLKAYAEDLKRRMQRLRQVTSVEIRGYSKHQFRVELSAAALMQYDLDVSRVANLVSRQSLNMPAGSIEATERELVLRVVEERRDIAELQDIVIAGAPDGSELKLGDIATITDTFELVEEGIRYQGQRAVLLRVEKTSDQDTIRVADTVKQFIDRERGRMPESMTFRVTADMAPLISGRLNLLFKFLWQGALLVFFVMWLFFNMRLSFWVVASIPISVAGALFVMPMLGITVDMFTMVAILMALGLLMDDGIVIAESVATHAAHGKPAIAAAIDGVTQVRSGVISSFLTTTCVLGPLIFIGGEMGRVIRVVPIMLLIVLAFSLLEAFCILPSHLASSLSSTGSESRGAFRRRFDAGIDWAREQLFGKLIDRLISVRYLWVGTVICLFFLAIALLSSGILKYEGFPTPDGNWLEARLSMSAGTSFARTQETVRQITAALDRVDEHYSADQPGGKRLVGSMYVAFNQNLDVPESGPHLATVVVDLLDAEERLCGLDDVMQKWTAEIGQLPDVTTLAITEPQVVPSGRAIDVRVQGEDLDRLAVAADEMRAWFSQWKGVRNLTSDLRPGKEELQIRMREGSVGLGVNATALSRQLRAAFHGETAAEIQLGDESYDVQVMLERADRNELADLDYYRITLPDSTRVPLSAIAEIDSQRGWAAISRVDGRRAVTVRGDIDTRFINLNPLFNQFRRQFLPRFYERYPDVEVVLDGEIKKVTETQQSIAAAGMVGILGVFILLSFQFRSYVEPLIVMLAIPLSFIGVILGHLLLGYDLTIVAVFGFVSLAGVVINDSILLVLFLKQRIAAGHGVEEAAREASRQRFRAIMLTSLTTIAGLLPLLLERSFQAQMLIPMAISIAFGLLASTVLVLSVIPSCYVILADFGLLDQKAAPVEDKH
jgi:multidrug efflux pump subunit AcrB